MPISYLAKALGDEDWRDHLDPDLVNKLEKLLKRTKTYETAWRKAKKPALAQLWVGMAEMFYQVERMNQRLRRVEERQRQLLEAVEQDELDDDALRESMQNY